MIRHHFRRPGRSLASLLHQLFVSGDIHGQSALFGHDAREIDREAVGVVQFEGAPGSDTPRAAASSKSEMPRSSVRLKDISSSWICSETN
jgi:hypothetical protein